MSQLAWGILGTGAIARRFAQALATSQTGRLAAVASRDMQKARAFADVHGAPDAYGDYHELLADPTVEAVYISTPHPQHAEWAICTARAGKHILCEKPATMSLTEAERVVAEAKSAGVFFMEAFMYRCHPQTLRLVELIREGAIGEVGFIECAFAFRAEYNAESRLFSNALGGGGILDIGCYCTSMARLIAGAATGLPFANPTSLRGAGRIDPGEGTDVFATAVLEFPGDILAHLACGTRLTLRNDVRIFGSAGSITVTQPWFAGCPGATLVVQRGEDAETLSTETPEDLYRFEIDTVAGHLHEGGSPCMSPEDTLGNMQTLDAWRRDVGVRYACDLVAGAGTVRASPDSCVV